VTIAVVGGGIAGLASALFQARAGRRVVLIDRDPPPQVETGDDAFQAWHRPSVPQWRLAHNFHARARSVLAQRAPDVLQLLRDDGVAEVNAFRRWFPACPPEPGDDDLTTLQARRPAFELALRRAVEAEPGVAVIAAATATGLIVEDAPAGARVRGVQLDNGTRLTADLVLDCGGRRSRTATWLAERGIELPIEDQSCELTYYSRYFRRRPTAPADVTAHLRADLGFALYWTFVGDHDTYGLVFGLPPWDPALKDLRHTWAWDALVAGIPELHARFGPACGEPLHDVQVMAGHRSVLRHHFTRGTPVVDGLLALGDALCTTNPFFAWGTSIALTHAAAAADAAAAHPHDAHRGAVQYYRSIADETERVYRYSAATDRIRTCRWRGQPIDPRDLATADQIDLIEHGVIPLAGTDPDVARALLRRIGLLDSPDAIFADRELVLRASAERARRVAARRPTITHDDAIALLRAARPTVRRNRLRPAPRSEVP
jgi:2-polyprenyl-6-methoxyphenol hydroxylase-like FAD-dependent oxidoreductase